MFDLKKNLMFELILCVPVGSGIRFKNSDLLDPDPAENGQDPQPCFILRVWGTWRADRCARTVSLGRLSPALEEFATAPCHPPAPVNKQSIS